MKLKEKLVTIRAMIAISKISGLAIVCLLALSPLNLVVASSLLPNIENIDGHHHNHETIGPILSKEDQALYREIFTLQGDGQMQRANKLIGLLENKILMGHVKYQRYMHPTAYRSKFSELSGWMRAYADHPGANRLYRLAKRRQGQARSPRYPVAVSAPRLEGNHDISALPTPKAKPRHNAKNKKEIRRITSRISRELRKGRPEQAEKRLWAFVSRDILSNEEIDVFLGRIANSYFLLKDDEKALAISSFAAERSRHQMAQADWVAGLSAWRLGEFNISADHFNAVANYEFASPWLRSAGAYWTARAHTRLNSPHLAEPMLLKAASFGETFYALLAGRQLGLSIDTREGNVWTLPELKEGDLTGMLALPSVRRVVALYEVGKDALADEELRLVWSRQQYAKREAIVALAAQLDLPATQVLLARAAPDGHDLPLSVFFPVPHWKPANGFEIDQAMFFALMRQESHFMPRARSRVGAMGLMQLMPATASWLTKDRSLRRSGNTALLEPELNMSISQAYMINLFGQEHLDANLFQFATAYNGGPGNLSRWMNKMDYQDDPLLFIETIPALETRNFIEKVLANLWVYRSRLGQPSPSLDAVASGSWPVYEPLDDLYPPRLNLKQENKHHAQN